MLVKSCKFSALFPDSIFKCLISFFRSIEITYAGWYTFYLSLRFPRFRSIEFRYPSKSRSIIFIRSTIPSILKWSTYSKIRSSIVQCFIWFFVIYMNIWNIYSHNKSMHIDSFSAISFPCLPDSIETFGVFIPQGMPIILAKFYEIRFIYNRYLFLRKRYISKVFVNRLDNFFSFFRMTHIHSLSLMHIKE